MKIPSNGIVGSSGEEEKKEINSELWHACAGPLVSLPVAGCLVVYFPQGHSEQVAATMQKEMDGTPSYPNLPSKLICMLRSVTLLADSETDEVYAQMTLQPVNKYDHDALLVSDFGLKSSRQPGEFFCKTLTASDTSTHGGFSVPRRAAEKIFPPLDFSMQPPAQELTARDLHNHTWTFRHIYRGQPKRHLLTSGWSVFVNSKRLVAGDAVLFIRDEKSQLLLGTRRANRQQPALSSSVMSSDSMHIGILAAAAHAAANNSPFTIFYNPRATSSEFVVPLAKYNKAMYTQVTPGIRFRMMFETEESGVRRYMGTVTSVSDLDPVRWKNSQWCNIQVGWDESAAGERPSRVSIWDIEPVVTPFYICPPPFFRPKLPGHHPGFTDDNSDVDNIFNRGVPWASEEFGLKDASSSSVYPGLSLVQWMSLQQNHQPLPSMVSSNVLPGNGTSDDHSKLFHFQPPLNFQMRNGSLPKQSGQVPQSTVSWPQQQQLQQTLPSPGMVQQPQHQQHQQPQLQHQLPLQQTQQNAQQQQTQQNAQQQQQSMIMHPVTSSLTSEKAGMNPHQPTVYSQVQQQESLTGTAHLQQNVPFTTGGATVSAASLTQSLLFQQNTAQQRNLVQSHPQPQQNLPNQQQQRQKQISASMNSFLEHQSNPEHEMQLPSLPPPQSSGSSFSASMLMQSQQFPVNQGPGQQKAPLVNGGYSNWTDSNGPSCSTSLYKSNLQVPHGNGLRNHTGSAALQENSMAHLSSSTGHESNSKIDVQVNHNLPISKASEHPKCKGSAVDHLDAASSATSYCFDTGGLQQNFPLAGLDDVQSHIQSSVPFATAVDGLTPDALLLRSSESGKDVHNLFSGYDGAPRDIETDFSSGINSQSFGLPNMFKPGYSNNADINETGVLNGGPWPNQSQRMRTYTKVQKRGSVGRTIDVTRYMGYDELRNDLARMFGIEGLLEDPQQTEWKLVYVDQEHDILLVGDDPWEEFVGCVQSIKILSSGEVQQMSLDGDLGGQLPAAAPNQACSSTDNGNAWR